MKTREEIKESARRINGVAPGIGGMTNMLYLILEVMLDIREISAAIEANQQDK